jgi:hypothetical protein
VIHAEIDKMLQNDARRPEYSGGQAVQAQILCGLIENSLFKPA